MTSKSDPQVLANLTDRTAPASAAVDAGDPTLKQLLHVVVATVIIGALYLAREILMPLTAAVLLAFVLAPLVQLFRRIRLPRVAAVFAAVALAIGLVGVAGILLAGQFRSLVDDLPQYQGTIQAKVGDLGRLPDTLTKTLRDRTGLGGLLAPTPAPAAKPGAAARRGATVAAPVVPVVAPRPTLTSWELLQRVAAPVLKPIGKAGLIFVVAVFVLLQQGDLRDRLIRLVGSSDLHRTTLALDDAGARLSRYFASQLGVNLAFGLVVAGGLYLIGLPHAALFGAIAAVLRYIPYIGTLTSAGISAAMAAAVDPGWALPVWTLALFVGADLVTGQVVEPLLYGHSTGLTPVSVVVAAVFWTWLWGPIGLVLSTPLSLCLLVLGRHVPRLAFFEVILGDSAPLSPVEICYQRLLGANGDDLLQQASELLKTQSLSDYYDEVVLKALLVAARDEHRGSITRNQLATIRTTAEALVEALAARPPDAPAPADGEPQPKSTAASRRAAAKATPSPRGLSVRCVPGPGILDPVGAAIVRQVMDKQGFAAMLDGEPGATRAQVVSIATFYIGSLRVLTRAIGARTAEAGDHTVIASIFCSPERWSEVAAAGLTAIPASSVRDTVDLCVVATVG